MTEFGQVKNKFGVTEIRTAENYPEPFPLYPHEKMIGKVENLKVVNQNFAIRLRALRDFFDGKVKRKAGEEWQIKGPITYIPNVDEEIVKDIPAIVLCVWTSP